LAEWQARRRRKNDRIAWKTIGGMSHSGVVSFHRLDSRLTRVMVTIDFVPQGVVEKMASGLRFVKRAVQADLARFKAYVEMEDAKGLEYGAGVDSDRGESSDQRKPDKRNGSGGSREAHEAARRERERRGQNRQKVDASELALIGAGFRTIPLGNRRTPQKKAAGSQGRQGNSPQARLARTTGCARFLRPSVRPRPSAEDSGTGVRACRAACRARLTAKSGSDGTRTRDLRRDRPAF
jgi:hypothetical protein